MNRRMRIMRRRIAFILSTMMILTLMQVPVYAGTPVNIAVDDTSPEEDKKVETGDVTIEEDQNEPVAVDVNDSGQELEVKTGSITNKSENGVALHADVHDGADAVILADGPVDANGTGVNINTNSNSVADVTVSGDIKANTGTESSVSSNGESYLLVEGDITAQGEGVYSASDGNGLSYTGVHGDIESSGDTAANLSAHDDGASTMYVTGNVTGELSGITLHADDGGYTGAAVEGNVSGGELFGVDSWSDAGIVDVVVGGDITGGEVGILLNSKNNGENYVVSEGTVSGGKVAIAMQNSDIDPLQVVVWKAVPNDQGVIAAERKIEGFGEDAVVSYEENKELEAKIGYVIKVTQPEKGGTVRATAADGSQLAMVTGMSTDFLEYAYAGEKVLLKVDIAEGYEITAAYGDVGQQYPLEKDADGNYFIIVPRGGGVMLSVQLDLMSAVVPVACSSSGDTPETTGGVLAGSEAGGYSDADALAVINAGYGSTITIYTTVEAGLSSQVMDALAIRPDVTANVIYSVDGTSFCTVMPAGMSTGIARNASGGADIMTLIAAFGAAPI